MSNDVSLRLRITADSGNTEAVVDTLRGSVDSLGATAQKTAGGLSVLGGAPLAALTGAFAAAQVAAQAFMAGLDMLANAIRVPVEEVLDAEKSLARLEGAFRGNAQAISLMVEAADQLSASSPFFDDDSAKAAEATLATFGMLTPAIQELLPFVHDLAAATGTDMTEAAQKVAQALMGQTRGLAQFVPEVRGASSQLEVLNAIQAASGRTAETAARLADGLTGSVARQKKEAAEAAQAWGNLFLPAIKAGVDAGAALSTAFGSLAGVAGNALKYIGDVLTTTRIGIYLQDFSATTLRLAKAIGEILGPAFMAMGKAAVYAFGGILAIYGPVLGGITQIEKALAFLLEGFVKVSKVAGAFLGGVVGGGSLKAGMDEASRLAASFDRVQVSAAKAGSAISALKVPDLNLDKILKALTLPGTFGGDGGGRTGGQGGGRTGTSERLRAVATGETFGPAVPPEIQAQAAIEGLFQNLAKAKPPTLDLAPIVTTPIVEATEAMKSGLSMLSAAAMEGARGLVASAVQGREMSTGEIVKNMGMAASAFLGPFSGLGALAAETIGGILTNMDDAQKIMAKAKEGLDVQTRMQLEMDARNQQGQLELHRSPIVNFWNVLTGQSIKEHAEMTLDLRRKRDEEAQANKRKQEMELREAERTAEEVRRALLKAAEFERSTTAETTRIAIQEAEKAGRITAREARFQEGRLSAAERASASAGGLQTELGRDIFGALQRATAEQTKAIAGAASSGNLEEAARLLKEATGFTAADAVSLQFVLNLFRDLALDLVDDPAAPSGGVKLDTEVPGASPDRPVYSFVTNPEDFSRYAFMPRSFAFRPSKVSSRAVTGGKAVGAAIAS